MPGSNGLGLKLILYSFKSNFLISPGADTSRHPWLCFATGREGAFFGQSFCLSFHITATSVALFFSQFFFFNNDALDTMVKLGYNLCGLTPQVF